MFYKKSNELKDTVDGMTSSDYKERFIAEYTQTKIRAEKLKKFILKIELAEMTGTEAPDHNCPFELLKKQLHFMDMYLYTLELRALCEHIEL